MITAVGTIFLSLDTKRIMLGMRSSLSSYPLTWNLFGGKTDNNETYGDALFRELEEEIAVVPPIIKTFPLDNFISKDNNFKYASYVSVVKKEFIPLLNKEHVGYCWIPFDKAPPRPLHFGTKIILENKNNIEKIQNIISILSM